MLPNNAIQPGSFTVRSAGGADVAAFESTVQIGSGIQVTTPLAGKTISFFRPLTINWTGGDPNSWVTVSVVRDLGSVIPSRFVQARASDGTVTMATAGGSGTIPPNLVISGPVEIVIEVEPDPARIAAFSATGLSLGGRASWKYVYRFQGVLVQ